MKHYKIIFGFLHIQWSVCSVYSVRLQSECDLYCFLAGSNKGFLYYRNVSLFLLFAFNIILDCHSFGTLVAVKVPVLYWFNSKIVLLLLHCFVSKTIKLDLLLMKKPIVCEYSVSRIM